MDFPDPPAFNPNGTRLDRLGRVSEAFAKAVCKASADPREALAAAYAGHLNRFNQRGLSAAGLRQAGFPVDVRPASCNTSPVAHFLTGFSRTPLAEAWVREGDRDDGWRSAGTRGLAFSWAGWGLCVLNTVNWLARDWGAVAVADPDEVDACSLLWVDPVGPWAKAIGWVP